MMSNEKKQEVAQAKAGLVNFMNTLGTLNKQALEKKKAA